MAWVAAGVLVLPLLLLAVFTRWGVLVAVGVAITVGLGIWVWQRGFVFVEIVAFLIHFDGLGAGPIRMGRVMAGVAAVVIVVKLIKGWRPPAIPVRHWAPVWVLTSWAVLSGLWSLEAGTYLYTFGVYGLGIAFFCITGMLIDSHRMVQQFLRAYWVGGLFGSGAGIVALFLGTRSVGFGQDPNFFGLIQASMIPLTVYYRRHAVTREARWLYTVALVVVLAGAAGAGSRSGLIGGALAIVGTMVTRPGLRPGRRVLVGMGAIVLAGIAFVVGFVANPNNLQRGFADRGAGRVDLWNVTIALIRENPLWGYGFGQIKTLVPPNLLLTPGSQRLNELRPDVSAHNTWLDILGDLGIVGMLIFLTVIVVALIGFARPRWLQTRELSMTLFVMMLPVLSGSFFLPLLNNKLGWALIGLSASLQVPSVAARWSGMAAALDRTHAPPGTALATTSSGAELDTTAPAPPAVVRRPGERPEAPGEEVWEPVELARWDLRVSRRFVAIVVAAAFATAFVFGVVGGTRPTTYTATAGVWVPKVDGTVQTERVRFDRERLQSALTLGVSGAYAQQLIEVAGLDLPVDEVRAGLDATRPRMGSYIEISYTSRDRAAVEAVLPHLIESLDRVYADARAVSLAQTEDELRPLVPGESRVYTGPAYLDAFPDPDLSVNSPRTGWYAFVGFLVGALAAAGFLLAGQRHPRVMSTDDLRTHVGYGVWAHVGGAARRRRATRDQYAQVLTTACALASGDDVPRRIVVVPPRSDAQARRLASGLAAEVVTRGGRALLVDADVQRPWLSARLGGLGRPGLRDVGSDVELAQVIRRINPLRLPRLARRMVGAAAEDLRFVPAGRVRRQPLRTLPLAELEQVDPEVTVIVLAPPTLGDWPTGALLSWADALVLPATVGLTTTRDLEETAAQAHASSAAPTGVVLVDG